MPLPGSPGIQPRAAQQAAHQLPLEGVAARVPRLRELPTADDIPDEKPGEHRSLLPQQVGDHLVRGEDDEAGRTVRCPQAEELVNDQLPGVVPHMPARRGVQSVGTAGHRHLTAGGNRPETTVVDDGDEGLSGDVHTESGACVHDTCQGWIVRARELPNPFLYS